MIERRLTQLLKLHLAEFPVVALLGPRQVGKTTLARINQRELRQDKSAVYLDLEKPSDLEKLQDLSGYLAAKQDQLVILDEVQRVPEIFRELRGIIDERVLKGQRTGHFLLLGSASMELLRQSSESLAGRIAYLELSPLDVLEIPQGNFKELWIRGGFPESYLADTEAQSLRWRENFITTYLERDIPQLGPRIPAETLRRFWTMLCHNQGQLFNASQLAKSLAVTSKTVSSYLDLMVDLLLVRRLPPHFTNVRKRLVKSPKVYVRDSGLVHSLLRIDSWDDLLSHPVAGMSWEGFVIENLIRAAPQRSRASFYRTATGVETDLVLQLPGNKLWAIEIKKSSAPKLERGLRQAIEDLQSDKTFIVYSGEQRYPKGENIEVISVREMAEILQALEDER